MNVKPKLSLIEKIREIAILIRIQQLGASITAVIGGLTVKGFGLDLFDFILLFIIGLIINIGGQVHNDIKDFDIDKRSNELKDRPLVKGTVSFKTAKVIILLCLISVFAIILYFFPNMIAILVIIISFMFGVLYNIYSKKFPGADLFLSVSTDTIAISLPYLSVLYGSTQTILLKHNSETNCFALLPKGCFFSGASIPYNLITIGLLLLSTVMVSPSVILMTFPVKACNLPTIKNKINIIIVLFISMLLIHYFFRQL